MGMEHLKHIQSLVRRRAPGGYPDHGATPAATAESLKMSKHL